MAHLVEELQAGWDEHDAEVSSRHFADNIAWGGPFSEIALYVLVKRNGTWWLAAGQNTPVRPAPD